MNRRADIPMPERIRVRVLIEEKRQMQDAARRRGLTLSDFVRKTVLRPPYDRAADRSPQAAPRCARQ